jgi:hypothetical protein
VIIEENDLLLSCRAVLKLSPKGIMSPMASNLWRARELTI